MGLQVSIPLWALVHLPVVVTVTTAIFTPKGWLHCILYVLFENAMGIVKMGAVIAGESSSLVHVPVVSVCMLYEPVCCFMCQGLKTLSFTPCRHSAAALAFCHVADT